MESDVSDRLSEFIPTSESASSLTASLKSAALIRYILALRAEVLGMSRFRVLQAPLHVPDSGL